MEVTKETALNILNSRSLISEAGKYTAKCTSVNPYTRDSGQQTYIVNFNCMTNYHANIAKKAFKAGDYDEAINNTSLTASQLEGMYVPVKGETVDIEVGEFVNKDGQTMLVVNSIIARKAVQAKKFSMSFDDEDEDEITAEDMIEALVDSGEYTLKAAQKLTAAKLEAAYKALTEEPEIV